MAGSAEQSLKSISLFEKLPPDDLARLERLCAWRRWPAGQEIVGVGSPSSDIFFIIEGAVHILDHSLSGREVAFAKVGPGEWFGELAALDGMPRSASVVAAEASLLAALPSRHFIDLLRENAEVTFKVLTSLAAMIRQGDSRIMELSTLAASQRVYAELLRLAQPDAAVPGLWVVRPLPPLREIASKVSTSRETVARAMGQVYGTGLVRRKGRNLYLMDRAKLESQIRALQMESHKK